MFVSFDQMPATARVWIYQTNRELSDAEQAQAESATQSFLESWAAHQQALKASAKVFHHRFLVITVDESHNAASGCSIDASVHFLQQLEKQLDVSLFDRSQLAYWDNGTVRTVPVKDLKPKVAEGSIRKDTLIFNNVITQFGQLQDQWMQAAETSWLKRYFK
ncbi:MAG: hypothetical protein HC880_01980 [Bacteroidia bacterium]|nr:hypothetical protein [Bacteroidia bacterium]